MTVEQKCMWSTLEPAFLRPSLFFNRHGRKKINGRPIEWLQKVDATVVVKQMLMFIGNGELILMFRIYSNVKYYSNNGCRWKYTHWRLKQFIDFWAQFAWTDRYISSRFVSRWIRGSMRILRVTDFPLFSILQLVTFGHCSWKENLLCVMFCSS